MTQHVYSGSTTFPTGDRSQTLATAPEQVNRQTTTKNRANRNEDAKPGFHRHPHHWKVEHDRLFVTTSST